MPDSRTWDRSCSDSWAGSDSDGEGGERLDSFLASVSGAFTRNTERALRADLRIFVSWCRQHRLDSMPARTATVVAFIDEMERDKAPATVRRYVSSIATFHRVLRAPNPVDSAAVRLALQRMYRIRGRRQAQVQGLTWSLRNRLLEAAGSRLIDVRNRALVGVAYDTLLRRSELVSLRVCDLTEEVDGSATLLVRKSKTDAEGSGAVLYLAPRHRVARQGLARPQRSRPRAAAAFGAQGRLGGGTAPTEPGAPHLQGDGPARRASRRYRGRSSGAQHARGAGSGHDRLRNRVAGDPPGRPLEKRADGPAIR